MCHGEHVEGTTNSCHNYLLKKIIKKNATLSTRSPFLNTLKAVDAIFRPTLFEKKNHKTHN